MPDIFLGEFYTDLEPPYVTNRFPANLATSVATNTNVSFDVIDVGGSGVDVSSVTVTFNGIPVIVGGVFQAGYTGSLSPILDGYTVTIDPSVDFSTNPITVVVNASDTNPLPNVMVPDSWTFYLDIDFYVPYVENQGPLGSLQPLDAHIVFDIKDDGSLPVDPTSIVVSVQGVPVYVAMSALLGYTVIVTPITGGYHFDLAAPTSWDRGTYIPVSVDADDTVNVMPTVTWSFLTTTAGLEKCNPAPLLPVEIRLRTPLRTAQLETLRRHVLTIISRDPMLDHRIRGVLLTAHFNDFRPVFADVLPVPPLILLETICKRRKLFDLYNDLRLHLPTMREAAEELRRLGLSHGYIELIRARIETHSPQQVVDTACAILLFGSLLQIEQET